MIECQARYVRQAVPPDRRRRRPHAGGPPRGGGRASTRRCRSACGPDRGAAQRVAGHDARVRAPHRAVRRRGVLRHLAPARTDDPFERDTRVCGYHTGVTLVTHERTYPPRAAPVLPASAAMSPRCGRAEGEPARRIAGMSTWRSETCLPRFCAPKQRAAAQGSKPGRSCRRYSPRGGRWVGQPDAGGARPRGRDAVSGSSSLMPRSWLTPSAARVTADAARRAIRGRRGPLLVPPSRDPQRDPKRRRRRKLSREAETAPSAGSARWSCGPCRAHRS